MKNQSNKQGNKACFNPAYTPDYIVKAINYLQNKEAMTTEEKVIEWAIEKGTYSPDNIKNQTLKMCAEAGELADAVLKGDDEEIKMEAGDVLVTLTIICGLKGYSLEDALQAAYNKIKDRKGETVNGTFFKSKKQ